MDDAHFPHAELTRLIIGAYYDVYNALGSGFREAVYERALLIALQQHGLSAQVQVPVPVWFRGQRVGLFRADVVVEQKVLLELKALPQLERSHVAQTLNALRATGLSLGLLLNFGPKPAFRRLIVGARKPTDIVR